MESSDNIWWGLVNGSCKTFPAFLDRLDYLITESIGLKQLQAGQAEIVDEDFLKEITTFCQTKALIHFGKSLKDLKVTIIDKKNRKHEMWVKYVGPKMFRIADIDAPKSYIQDQVYKSLEDIVNVFIKHIDELSNYFEQMDSINKQCIVVEPVKPTYKDSYRKIRLADRIWLHVEVSSDGSAKNLRLLGQTEHQHHKLQDYLFSWDHDKSIAINAMKLCALNDDETTSEGYFEKMETEQVEEIPECRICLSVELYDDLSKCGPSVPQPLCNNTLCGVYYHRSCLYTWLEGGRPPPFGVAIGACPCCLQPIQCSEKDV